jgi:tRNA threonylcarbamoyladenosine biosynthesis protein TsaE
MHDVRLISPNENCTLLLGYSIGEQTRPGDVLALWGELGSGKTLFTRGVARGLGVPHQAPITSPTFTIINEYQGRLRLYHLDLYRLTTPDDLETLPWREVLFADGVAVIEWPDRLGSLLPDKRWDITFEFLDDNLRAITFSTQGESHGARLVELARQLTPIAQSPSQSKVFKEQIDL